MKKNIRIFGTAIITVMAMALTACGTSGSGNKSNPENASSELRVEATHEDMEYEETTTTTTETTTTTSETTTDTTTTTEAVTETKAGKQGGKGSGSGGVKDSVHRSDSNEKDLEYLNTYSPVSSFAIDDKWCNMAVEGVDLNINSIIDKYKLSAIDGEDSAYTGCFNEMGFTGNGYYTFTHPATGQVNTNSSKAYFMTNDSGDIVAAAFKDLSSVGQVSVGDANDMRITYVDGIDISTISLVFGDSPHIYKFENGLNALIHSDGYFSTIFILGSEDGLSPEEVSEILVINNNYLTVKE